MLTIGWSDGYSFIPTDFAMLSSAKKTNRYQEANKNIDKRTNGYKRRMLPKCRKRSIIGSMLVSTKSNLLVKLVEINRSSLKKLGISLDNYNINVSDVGRLPSSYALPATLDFLEQEGKGKVLASPKIRAVHGKKATINIGEVIPVPYYRYETASNTLLGYTPQVYKEYKDVQVGMRLDVTPFLLRKK